MEQQPQPQEQPTENPGGKVRRMSQKQYQYPMLIGGLIIIIGVIFWMADLFKEDTADQASAQETVTENQTAALAVPSAQNAPLMTDKYREASSNDPRFNPNNDPNREMNTAAVLGAERTDRQVSNEYLTSSDFAAVGQAGQQADLQSAATRKREIFRQSSAQQHAANRENARLADPNAVMFRKSAAEIADERRTAEDRAINQRTANLLLDRMEKGQSQGTGGPGSLPGAAAAQNSGDPVMPSTRSASEPVPEETIMHGEVSRNTVGQPNNKVGFFYNFSRKNAGSYSGNEAIVAVIHGQGSDGVTVQDGSTIKVRLMQNTVFRLKGEDIMLEKGMLLNGLCSIGSDRVFISVTSLVIGKAIYPVTVQAFDIDGQQGIHVPNLAEKNRVAQGLTQAAGQASQGGSYFVGQGNAAQQIGTQVGVQGARSVFQGARQLLTAKAQNPKVTIRPNYKVLLKSAQLAPTTSAAANYEGY